MVTSEVQARSWGNLERKGLGQTLLQRSMVALPSLAFYSTISLRALALYGTDCALP
jgi:hypothetical protein